MTEIKLDDSFPYVSTFGDLSTKRLLLKDILTIPTFASKFSTLAPLANPIFTGTVTGSFAGPLNGVATNVSGIVAVVNGGTGASTKNNALNNLLPTQTSNSGKALVTNGSDSVWSSIVNSINGFVGDVTLTKFDIGLGNADNTSDLNKPISTATQSALNLKAPLASPTLTGTPTAPTAAFGDNSTKIATTAFVAASAPPAANKYLSNLLSPTAVNQDLVPDVDATRNFGSASLKWNNAYFHNTVAATGLTSRNGGSTFSVGVYTSTPSGLSPNHVLNEQGDGATLAMATSSSSSVDTGALTFETGKGLGTINKSGGITLLTGATTGSGYSGDIVLKTGTPTGTGGFGTIKLQGDSVVTSASIYSDSNSAYTIGQGSSIFNSIFTGQVSSGNSAPLILTSGNGLVAFNATNISVNSKISDVTNPTLAQDAATKSYVDSAMGAGSGAATDLFNLTTPTRVQVDLLPNVVGGASLGDFSKKWQNVIATSIIQGGELRAFDSAQSSYVQLRGSNTLPSGAILSFNLNPASYSKGLGIYTLSDNVTTSQPSGSINIETGNKTLGAGNSGPITISTGTSLSGARGVVSLDGSAIDVNTKKIINVATPVNAGDAVNKSSLDAATTKTIISGADVFASTASGSYVDSGLTVTVTSTGKPVFIGITPDAGLGGGYIVVSASAGQTSTNANFKMVRDTSTDLAIYNLGQVLLAATNNYSVTIPCSSIWYIDTPAAGSHTYKVQYSKFGNTVGVRGRLVAYEM